MSAKTCRILSRLVVSVLAGALCGIALGWAAAVFECSLMSMWDGTGRTLRDVPTLASNYGLGGICWGALCGVLDFAVTAVRRKPAHWSANAVLWALIAITMCALAIAAGGWPQATVILKLVILMARACFGAIFGAVVALAPETKACMIAGFRRWSSLTRGQKAAIAGIAVALALPCYAESFFLVRKPISLSRFADGSMPASGNITFIDTLAYYYSKDDRLNYCMWYIYWSIASLQGMDRRSLTDRLSEPADAEHNGHLPTYVRELDELRRCTGNAEFPD